MFNSLLMSTLHGKNKHKTIATVMGLVYVACVVHIGWNNVLLSSADQVKATAQRENMQIQNPTGAMQQLMGFAVIEQP